MIKQQEVQLSHREGEKEKKIEDRKHSFPLFFFFFLNLNLLSCFFVSLPAVCVTEAEPQAADATEVIYDDVPSEDPLSPDDGQ